MREAALVIVVLVGFAGCASSDGSSDGVDASARADFAGPTDMATPFDGPAQCNGVMPTCTGWNTRAFCVGSATGPVTQTETCPSGCYNGACSTTACSDECALGTTSNGKTCQLWSMSSQSFVMPDVANSLHDRARDYDRELRAIDLPQGAVMNANFTDQTYTTVASYSGVGDSSIWTGTALASQAWRLLVTHEPDAAIEMSKLAAEIHLFFNVTGDPGYLARLAFPTSWTTPIDNVPCSSNQWHCNVAYQNTQYHWLGHTSRDQYTGAMLGYAIAYMAAEGNEPLRATIRGDVVGVVQQLMKSQTFQAAVTITNPNVPIPVTINKMLTLENVILAPSEMSNGAVVVTIDSSNAGNAEMTGLREFLPDFSALVSQLLGTSVPIPRASTTMMLGGFFNMALMMTDGVPGMESTHASILAYYQAHVQSWLSIAKGWTFGANCGHGYFANHIAFIMAYVWALLEKDPTLATSISTQVVDGALWHALSGQKNSYFAFMWGGTRSSPDATQIASAVTQFTGFPPGPRIDHPTALENDPAYMPHDATCGNAYCDTATLATDVKDRRIDDFIWQRDPWELSDSGNPLLVYPGVDYLAAYWLGRFDGFIAEDAAGTCARFGP